MTYFSVVREGEGFLTAWPTKGQIYFARLDGSGAPQSPAETRTSGTSGMRTGVLALAAKDGSTLATWKRDGQLGWQLYDAKGRPSGSPGSAKSPGHGAAGVVTKEGEFVLFR
jgi:hypothetical protein